jgi:hypothetical protein
MDEHDLKDLPILASHLYATARDEKKGMNAGSDGRIAKP